MDDENENVLLLVEFILVMFGVVMMCVCGMNVDGV